jgi:hypothetical protein
VLLEGVGEIAIAAFSDSWPRAYAARLRTVAPEARTCAHRTGWTWCHGGRFADAPAVDRVLIAGEATTEEAVALAAWTAREGLVPESIATEGFP